MIKLSLSDLDCSLLLSLSGDDCKEVLFFLANDIKENSFLGAKKLVFSQIKKNLEKRKKDALRAKERRRKTKDEVRTVRGQSVQDSLFSKNNGTEGKLSENKSLLETKDEGWIVRGRSIQNSLIAKNIDAEGKPREDEEALETNSEGRTVRGQSADSPQKTEELPSFPSSPSSPPFFPPPSLSPIPPISSPPYNPPPITPTSLPPPAVNARESDAEASDEKTSAKTSPSKRTSKPKVQWAEFVFLTNDEHDKLLATHGTVDTNRLIEILDNYKGQSGRKYRSDYRAILNWVIPRLKEEKEKEERRNRAKNCEKSGGYQSGNQFLEILREEEESEWTEKKR